MNRIPEFKERLRKDGRKGLALDLDDTVCVTSIYYFQRMMEKWGNPEKMTPYEMARKYKFANRVPYWKSPKCHEYLKTMWNSEEWQKSLTIVESANKIVQRIHQTIPILAYITARPSHLTTVSKEWLKKNNFPQAEVITRPDSIDEKFGNEWKALVLRELQPQITGIVDDNPAIIEHLTPDYKGRVYLFNYEEYAPLPEGISVICCKTWKEVERAIHSHLEKRRHSF